MNPLPTTPCWYCLAREGVATLCGSVATLYGSDDYVSYPPLLGSALSASQTSSEYAYYWSRYADATRD